MTPFALRIMHKVRQKEHGSHEAWFQAIVDETLDGAAQIAKPHAYLVHIAILALKEQEPCE